MSKDDQSSGSDKPYIGPERRKGERRKKNRDRRDKLRFEIEKDPRRSGKERRKQKSSVWDEHDF